MRTGCPFTEDFLPLPAQEDDAQSEELLAGGTPVYVTAAHRFGADAMLLADFAQPRRDEAACDLGSGCGIIPLRWHDLGHCGRAVGVELSPAGTRLLKQAAARCSAQISALTLDLRLLGGPACPEEAARLLPAGSFDLVSCNPPYFTGGFVSQKPGRAAARHAVTCTVEDAAKAAAYLLKNGGDFCQCNRPERLADVIDAARRHQLEPKRLQFVKKRPESEPWLFLLSCRRQGKPGLRVLPDLVSCDERGGNSEALRAVYRKRKENP